MSEKEAFTEPDQCEGTVETQSHFPHDRNNTIILFHPSVHPSVPPSVYSPFSIRKSGFHEVCQWFQECRIHRIPSQITLKSSFVFFLNYFLTCFLPMVLTAS